MDLFSASADARDWAKVPSGSSRLAAAVQKLGVVIVVIHVVRRKSVTALTQHSIFVLHRSIERVVGSRASIPLKASL